MNRAEDRPFDSLHVGDSASFERRISEEDVRAFAELSGDFSPLHTDGAYARSTPFGGQIVHGMFLGALVSRLVGMQLPGKRALLMKESIEFKRPVHIEEIVRVEGVIANMSLATHIIELEISISATDTTVATGRVHVQVRSK